MASSSAPVHPARYLSVFLVLLIGVYLLVFLTGDKRAAPKLGIDLQGGTRVTLTARTPDGSRPSREALAQAQQIIGARVNGLGVSGSEVVVDGDNLIITVPGNDGNEARNLGQTARLYIRPVLNSMPAQSAEPKPPAHQPAPGQPAPGQPAPAEPAPAEPAPAEPGPSGQPAAGQPAPPPAGQPAPGAKPGAQPRPYPQDPPPAPTPAPPAPG
ncbi:protein translocase subunit SecD, partial [Mycobacterium intracellulare subsp. chimaera]|nr:protein translocase subunit SecD [Mycobacterium intracellulare subsp. chimaera]